MSQSCYRRSSVFIPALPPAAGAPSSHPDVTARCRRSVIAPRCCRPLPALRHRTPPRRPLLSLRHRIPALPPAVDAPSPRPGVAARCWRSVTASRRCRPLLALRHRVPPHRLADAVLLSPASASPSPSPIAESTQPGPLRRPLTDLPPPCRSSTVRWRRPSPPRAKFSPGHRWPIFRACRWRTPRRPRWPSPPTGLPCCRCRAAARTCHGQRS